MDAIIISNENNIFHITIEDDKVDYSFYDKKGYLLDGGVLEGYDNSKSNREIINEIISSFKEQISFTEPFVYLSKEHSEELLEYIEEENYNYIQEKVAKISKEKTEKFIDNDEMDIEK